MKTKLPKRINTISEAKAFLTALHNNGEAFHPDDDAHDIVWNTSTPTNQELDLLNTLMGDILNLNGFDPYEFLLNLINLKQ